MSSKSFSTPSPRISTRAITSTIASRAAPSLPSASHSYEPLVKALFRHRLKYSLLLSALGVSCITTSWAIWHLGGIREAGLLGAMWTPFSPWTLFMTFMTWATVALPIIVLRKVFLTAHRSAASTPLSIIKIALTRKSSRVAGITYLLSSICVLVLHGMDTKLSLFVKSKKHPHYLNGRLLFLITTQVFTALAFLSRGAMRDRFVYRWEVATSSKKNWIPLRIAVAVVASAICTTLALVASSLCFGLSRVSLPILYKIPFLSILLRPFTNHFLKGPWTLLLPLYNVGLLFRAWFLAFSTFIIWETADDLFENVIAERVALSTVAPDPNTTLVAGVASGDRIFRFFAYSELRELAMEDSASASARRTSLFGDQKNVPNLWSFLARESLLLLGDDYQLFLRRGKPLPPSTGVAPILPKATFNAKIGTPTPLLRQRIFKNAKGSPGQAALDALASDGPIAQALDAGADATHVPELFRSVEHKVLTSPVAEEAKKNVDSARSIGNRIGDGVVSLTGRSSKHIPEPVKDSARRLMEWCTTERSSRMVEASLPFRELDVVVIDVMSYFVCASLAEDRYGIVQRDIPKILEAMISFLSVIEEYQMEVSSLYIPSSSEAQSQEERDRQNGIALEVSKSLETLGYVADGLKEGIARIVRTFGDKLLAFKFPPRIAQKLQAFLDYS